MSKEREFLKKLRYASLLENNLRKELEELLAQPEQDNIQYLLDQVARLTAENAMLKEKWSTPKPEQEQQPEAWIIVNKETGYRTQVSDLTPFLYHREIFEVIPLYTAPPVKSEQEHVGIVRIIGGYPDNSERVVEWVRPYKYLKDGDKLYLAPKREPLSEDKLDVLAEVNITDEGIAGYYLGFRDAEKHHGIGGGEC